MNLLPWSGLSNSEPNNGAGVAGPEKESSMGQPVVHFEVIGKDGDLLRTYYSDLFGWKIDSNNPMNYGMVQRDGNTTEEGIGIAGGIAGAPEGYEGHVTFYMQVPDVEEALAKAESLGGKRLMGPDEIMGMLILGHFTDPEGHLIGVMTPL